MNSFVILSVVLSILASNVHATNYRNYRMLSLNKPLDSGFMPMFNPEQRMMPQQAQGMTEQRMMPQQTMFNPEQRMMPQQTIGMTEQRMMPQQAQGMTEQRMMPQQTMVNPEQRMMPQQTMFNSEQRMMPQQAQGMTEQRMMPPQVMGMSESKITVQQTMQPQQRIEQQQLLQQQMQQQQQIQQQQIQQKQQIQQQQQQLAQQQQQQLAQQQIKPVAPKTIGRQTNTKETFCQGRKPDSVINHPTDPSKFIACNSPNDFEIMNCPSGLVFNINTMRCDNSRVVRGCATNPCRNGGVCTDMSTGMHQCTCPSGFVGINCEKDDHCNRNSCGPEGQCIPLGLGTPVGHYCICSNGKKFGMSCDSSNVEENPCNDHNTESMMFPVKSNPSIFVHCDGLLPNLKFCPWPLHFSVNAQQCDWRF